MLVWRAREVLADKTMNACLILLRLIQKREKRNQIVSYVWDINSCFRSCSENLKYSRIIWKTSCEYVFQNTDLTCVADFKYILHFAFQDSFWRKFLKISNTTWTKELLFQTRWNKPLWLRIGWIIMYKYDESISVSQGSTKCIGRRLQWNTVECNHIS